MALDRFVLRLCGNNGVDFETTLRSRDGNHPGSVRSFGGLNMTANSNAFISDHSKALLPGLEMAEFKPPKWFVRHGLLKYKPIVSMLQSSWRHLAQAEADGLTHLAPFIVLFNKPPAEIKAIVGGHVWQQIRTANVHTNCNRMVLRLVGSWSLDEAMEWPAHERHHARKMLEFGRKFTLLIACRHTRPGEDLMENLIVAKDFQRMNGIIDPTWGRKRLKREHDALATAKALEGADPTPWAKAWFYDDMNGYSFSLLKSESELAIESATQRHCVRSYAKACKAGSETVFSIMGPERATVSYNTRHMQAQVKGYGNRKVSRETRQAALNCITRYFTDLDDREAAGHGLD